MVREEADNDLTRLKLLSKGVMYALGVLSVLVLLFAAITVILSAALILDPASVTIDQEMKVELTLEQITVLVIVMAIILVQAGIILLMIASIACAISREYSPFTRKNVKRLEIIALAFLIVPFLFMAIVYTVLGDITLMDCLVMLFCGLIQAAVFYMLALVFDYGRWLQKESDETL